MKRIAIITVGELPVPSVKGGGAETLIEQILEENEKKAKIEFKVFSIKNSIAVEKAKEFKYAKFEFLDEKSHHLVSRIRRKFIKLKSGFDIPIEIFNYKILVKTLVKENYDLILIENTMVPFSMYTKKFGRKVVIHNHWDYINNEIPNCVLKHYKKAAINCGGIITVSEYIKKRILTVNDINSEKIYVLKNCTDLHRFNIKIDKEEKEKLREKYGIGKQDIVLVFTGRISKEKGVIELVQAFKKLQVKDNVKLVIVGSAKTGETIMNPYTQKVYDEIENIKDKIVFTGYVEYEDMPKIYKMSDIAVLPSVGQDPAPLTIFEAMAAGLPIITTYSGGIPEYANEKCALFSKIDEQISENLSENMRFLIENEDVRRKMSEQSCLRSKMFSTEKYYDNFVEIVEKITEEVL
jgi:glycosyltransferase involved in cell wall biosynthesis